MALTGRVCVYLGLAIMLTGCASVSVKDEAFAENNQPRQKPEKIYLIPMTTYGAEIRVDRDALSLARFEDALEKFMTDALVIRIKEHVAPVEVVASPKGIPRGNYWLVKSKFLKVHQGSRMLRTLVGLGLGGTKMETEVEVYDMNGVAVYPFLKFKTSGGSNAEPGLIGGAGGPGGTVAVGVGAAATVGVIVHGISEDAERTARMITATLSDYMWNRRWISDEERLEPKR